MKIGILGGRGFIGSKIVENLSNEHFFFIVRPEDHNSSTDLLAFKPDIIINASASLPDADEKDSCEANLNYPLSIFSLIADNFFHSMTWIQLASYYELESDNKGMNWYTKHKIECRNILKHLCSVKGINFRTLFLPHVIGKGERSNRLVKSAIISLQNNMEFELLKPEVKLPILILEDAVSAVRYFLKSGQSIASATPIWYKTSTDLLQEISELLGKKVEVKKLIDKDLSESIGVSFPQKVEGWTPKITLKDYILTL